LFEKTRSNSGEYSTTPGKSLVAFVKVSTLPKERFDVNGRSVGD
jgi:hypothetical protein